MQTRTGAETLPRTPASHEEPDQPSTQEGSMSDAIVRGDDLDAISPKVPDAPATPPPEAKLPPAAITKTQVTAQSSIMALTPRNLDEAWKMADAFYVAGMVPKS